MAATWKKVHLHAENTTHGTITANLTDINTAVTSGTNYELVLATTAGSSSELKTQTVNFGAGAFSAAPPTNYVTNNADDVMDGDLTVDNIILASDDDTTISVAGVAEANNVVGLEMNINAGKGRGTGKGGDIIFSVAPAGVSGNTENALAESLRIKQDKDVQFSADIVLPDVTGSNTAGNSIVFHGGASTGSGTGGSITFKTSVKDDDGAAVLNTFEDALTIAAATTEGGEPTVTIAGDLIVSGTTTTVNTSNLEVEDHIIMVATHDSPTPATGTAAGLEIETSTTAAARPRLEWTKDLGASNAATYDGSGTGAGLTGWGLKNHQASNQALFPISVMEFEGASATAPTGNSAGIGSFYFASSNIGTAAGELYIRVL